MKTLCEKDNDLFQALQGKLQHYCSWVDILLSFSWGRDSAERPRIISLVTCVITFRLLFCVCGEKAALPAELCKGQRWSTVNHLLTQSQGSCDLCNFLTFNAVLCNWNSGVAARLSSGSKYQQILLYSYWKQIEKKVFWKINSLENRRVFFVTTAHPLELTSPIK